MGCHAFSHPFTDDNEQRLAGRSRLRQHQIDAVDPGCLADESEYIRNDSADIRCLEQQPARFRRRGQQPLPPLERLVDLGQLL